MNRVAIDSLIPPSRIAHLHSFMLLRAALYSIRFLPNLMFYFVCKYYAIENNIIINDCIIVTNALLKGDNGSRWMKRAKLCYN